MKMCLLGADLCHVDRGTDGHDEVNSRFSQFYETRLKISIEITLCATEYYYYYYYCKNEMGWRCGTYGRQ